MAIELKIPEVGESITEVELGEWLKKPGDTVRRDEPVVTLESEKATVELPAPETGTLTEVLKQKGQTAKVGEVIGRMEKTTPKSAAGAAPAQESSPEPATTTQPKSGPRPAPVRVMPAAERALAERGVKAEDVRPT